VPGLAQKGVAMRPQKPAPGVPSSTYVLFREDEPYYVGKTSKKLFNRIKFFNAL
jgi:hypothetical protein